MLPFTGVFILFTSGGDTISNQSEQQHPQQQHPPPQGETVHIDDSYIVANYLATRVLLSSNHIAQ